jgi:AbrB family looped-hinge helix DNA binding protein
VAVNVAAVQEVISMEVRRIKVSEKRQITIPMKFFRQLHMKDEVDIFVKNGELIIRPAIPADHGFATEILKDLLSQGYTGGQLLEEFTHMQSQIRPAVERILAEADTLAKEALKDPNRKDKTAEIFADLEDSCE